MLLRMKEVIGQRTFDEGLFRQLFLSKLPQQVQAVLVTFNNNPVDELASSADRILEITRTRHNEVYSVTEKPLETETEITKLCHTLSRFLDLHEQRRPNNPRRRSSSPRRSSSRRRRTENPHWCWYHKTYGKESNKCRNPCCFPSLKPTASGNYPAGTR
uniref:SJCHGC08961 protein n=1 Tax=Schistosoma japonicum TaxID=6182 RepID=Q5DDY1_SCHJA|nr:SJCHGC08961 protein [Schistosoma japonicum]